MGRVGVITLSWLGLGAPRSSRVTVLECLVLIRFGTLLRPLVPCVRSFLNVTHSVFVGGWNVDREVALSRYWLDALGSFSGRVGGDELRLEFAC